ncbi:unnamed protein product [Didymodactylos carnosus]|uniref:TIR domain-containing protein n=1 Tax=Didymodactylos carnosus TaxID=1234261 RepID=A0A813T302_9BILA|nr:unnamed protein product [Didymodactylos carnosus]CAF3592061.1 unnamed protein product [Didymodactylos carnosus]
MTFNVRAADILRKDDIFMTRIRSLLKSDQEAVSKCAEGIIWKLEKEAEFMAKEQEKIVQQQQILTEDIQTDTHVTLRRASLLVQEIVEVEPAKNRYDIMMSYSHSDKELCYKIHERLLMDKFHVWIDLENMFGSTMSAMASAIENSEFVLVCMSDFYKQSSYCQVEAEYAFKRQRNLIPLIMREKYRPDGWLGILSASKMYIDFTKTDFDTAYDKLIIEIRRYRSQQPSITKQSYIEHHDIPNEKTKIISNEQEQTPRKPIIINSTNAYSKILLERWTEQDVQEFLMNKNLSQMMPLCNDMDGCGLIELYKMCETNSDGTYRSLNTQLHEMNQKTLPITVYSRFLSELKKYIVVKTTQKKSFMCTIL